MAVGNRPRWSELLVAGNFNAELTGPEGAERDEEIVADLAVTVLEDMLALQQFVTNVVIFQLVKGSVNGTPLDATSSLLKPRPLSVSLRLLN